jgi:hypothetical protein
MNNLINKTIEIITYFGIFIIIQMIINKYFNKEEEEKTPYKKDNNFINKKIIEKINSKKNTPLQGTPITKPTFVEENNFQNNKQTENLLKTKLKESENKLVEEKKIKKYSTLINKIKTKKDGFEELVYELRTLILNEGIPNETNVFFYLLFLGRKRKYEK